MNNKIGIIIILIVICNIALWPKKQEKEYVLNKLDEKNKIVIKLEGEIVYSGTYSFYDEIIYDDLFIFAGGLTNQADISNIDTNEKIKKSKTIVIKKKVIKETEPIKLNINKATYNDFLRLNLTEKRALNIIIYREQNGYFETIDDLIKVKYIGKDTLEKISNFITV
ncbi:ComEA family DNA-binding protein [Haploplasma axanthum]|uniref:ComE operon protein 1 n=1 Tax=Haploplasma axanthum TaxID=29552 RepID=A0A449BDZ0_HAPAX|nr:helix-hairpin-helix domain-containing protein [Haploplasma axanthum]VEU80674.1 ComE operon protein 1 [Haploplasma axanthum]